MDRGLGIFGPPWAGARRARRCNRRWQGRIALFALQRAHTASDFVAELASWLDLLRELLTTPQGLEDFGLLMRYIHRTADFLPTQLHQLVRQLGSQAEEVVMTAAERLRAEGEARGRVEGEAQGKLEGQAALLLKLLALRFGELSDDVRERVARANLEQLGVYAERVLSAASLDDVLR